MELFATFATTKNNKNIQFRIRYKATRPSELNVVRSEKWGDPPYRCTSLTVSVVPTLVRDVGV